MTQTLIEILIDRVQEADEERYQLMEQMLKSNHRVNAYIFPLFNLAKEKVIQYRRELIAHCKENM